MGIYERITDGFLYTLRWTQERMTEPPVMQALAHMHLGKTIHRAERMDFVSLSAEALRRSVPLVEPISVTSGTMDVKR